MFSLRRSREKENNEQKSSIAFIIQSNNFWWVECTTVVHHMLKYTLKRIKSTNYGMRTKNERTFKFGYFWENSASHKQFSKFFVVMVGVYYFYTELVKCLTENLMHAWECAALMKHLYGWLQFRCFQWTYVQLLISRGIHPDASQPTNEWFHELSHLFSTILELIRLKIAIPQIHSSNRLWLKCTMQFYFRKM